MNDTLYVIRAILWVPEVVIYRSLIKTIIDLFTIADRWGLEDFLWDVFGIALTFFTFSMARPFLSPIVADTKTLIAGAILVAGMYFGMHTVRIQIDAVIGKAQYYTIHQFLFGLLLGLFV